MVLSKEGARRYFDLLGAGLALEEPFVARAKQRALELLHADSGERVLNCGVGPGREQKLLEHAAGSRGMVAGLDLSAHMLQLARRRAESRALVRGDAEHLPFAAASFDAIFSAYMLDLFSEAAIAATLAEFRRVLRSGGRIALVSMTEGVTVESRMLAGAWKATVAVAPWLLGGCRPIALGGLLERAGFQVQVREVVVQRAAPSEIVLAGASRA